MRKIQSLVPSTFPFYGKDRTCLLRTRVATKEGCHGLPFAFAFWLDSSFSTLRYVYRLAASLLVTKAQLFEPYGIFSRPIYDVINYFSIDLTLRKVVLFFRDLRLKTGGFVL